MKSKNIKSKKFCDTNEKGKIMKEKTLVFIDSS